MLKFIARMSMSLNIMMTHCATLQVINLNVYLEDLLQGAYSNYVRMLVVQLVAHLTTEESYCVCVKKT